MGLFHQNSFCFLNYSRFSKTFYVYFILILALQSGLQLIFKKCKQHLETGLSESTELWAVPTEGVKITQSNIFGVQEERDNGDQRASLSRATTHIGTPGECQLSPSVPQQLCMWLTHGISSCLAFTQFFCLHCYCPYFLYMNQSIFNYKTNQQVLGKMSHVFLLVRILDPSWLSFYWATHTLPLNKFSLFAS